MVNRRLVAGVLFILTAIIHLLYPFLYGINTSTIGCAVFGIIYLALGILQYNNKVWVIRISIILPAFGLLVSLIDYFSYRLHISSRSFIPWSSSLLSLLLADKPF
jgi:phosphate/sulfate permease